MAGWLVADARIEYGCCILEPHHHGEHEDDHRDHDGHSHAHGHVHAPATFGRAFGVGIALNSIFVIVEAAYGVLAHSLALVADAGHNLSDVLGLFVAWGATVLARRSATKRYSYGLKRSSILAALVNAVLLLLSVGAIGWEALWRLFRPAPVAAQTMIWVSALGIVINALTALMFSSGRKSDLNIRGAFAHMAADAVISAGVVLAGVVILFTGWTWLDPTVSLILVAVVIYGTWELLRDSVKLALDAAPENVDPDAVQEWLESRPGIVNVHHLHIWALSTTETALTVHLVRAEAGAADGLLRELNEELKERFDIGHATIQFESAAERGCESKACAPD